MMVGFIKRSNIQIVVLVLLIAPVFFQLSGGSIFNDSAMIYDHGGRLARLPLPVSVIACFIGLILLIRYKACHSSAIFLFGFFVAMIIATFILSFNNYGGELGKIIFLIQYILPVFAMLLGQSYIEPVRKLFSFEAIFLYILTIVIPLEVVATLNQATGILTPYLYLFSIYQHLQYVPVIFTGLYFLALLSLYENSHMRVLLLFLAPFIGIYTVLSFSNITMLVTLAGMAFSLFILIKRRYIWFVLSVSAFIVLFIFVSINLEKINLYEYESKNSNFIEQKNAYFQHKNIFNPLIFTPDVIPLMDIKKFETGVVAYESGDFETAFREFLPLAEQGRINAHWVMVYVAKLYAKGKGVPQDFSKAIYWYRKAAEQGNIGAQHMLGTMHENGQGVPQNFSKAIYWYRKAAEQGNISSQYKLDILLGLMNGNDQVTLHLAPELVLDVVTETVPDVVHSNVAGRLYAWRIYLNGITESPMSFIFGHERRLSREVAPSAHNYYIDLVYNYGLISLLPFIILTMYTLIRVYKYRYNVVSSPHLLGLFVLLLFYLFIDNSLKVGLRQPYPGIITFFLWGVLLTRLEQLQLNE